MNRNWLENNTNPHTSFNVSQLKHVPPPMQERQNDDLQESQPLDPNLQDAVVEIKFLAVSWLDDFEKKVFEGKTVSDLLEPKGYA